MRQRKSSAGEVGLQTHVSLGDPDDVISQVRHGIDEIERGGYIEAKGERELRRLFDGIIDRGKARLAKRKHS